MTNKANKDTVMVIIPKPHNVVGDTETVVAVNGVMYQIMYDRPVEVPRNVAEVIEQSRNLQAKIMELTEAAVMKPGKAAIAEL
ncbi:MAG: hypothetical protein ACI4TH_03765 [Candidatus Ornithomonoglobus sp.]